VPDATLALDDASRCLACPRLALEDPAPRERVVATRHWSVAHAFNTALEGWLVVLPRRHVVAVDQLDAAEAAELGPLLVAVSRALRAVVGCEKTYVIQLAESPGFNHVHVHVVPRRADLPADLAGPRIFGLLGVDDDAVVPEARRDALALAIRAEIESDPTIPLV
jgi:diadenosine tetraphosphate (Ap4A) HIT family hydrolase